METLEAIKSRKSTRCYEQKPVEAEKIEALIAAANNAPKAGEIHISVIENTDCLKKINDSALTAMKNSGNEFLMSRAELEGYQPLYGAPVLMLFSAPADGPYNSANASCAAATITIAATAMEMGSCYVIAPLLGLNGDNELIQKVGVPEGFSPVCGVLVGYSAGDAFSAPKTVLSNVNYCK